MDSIPNYASSPPASANLSSNQTQDKKSVLSQTDNKIQAWGNGMGLGKLESELHWIACKTGDEIDTTRIKRRWS